MITEKLVDNLSNRTAPKPYRHGHYDTPGAIRSNKRRRDTSIVDEDVPLGPNKIYIVGTNDNMETVAAASTQSSSAVSSRRSSVVISNIAKNITPDHIQNFLASELQVEMDSIRVTPLAPAGKNLNELSYMQYRVSSPASLYAKL